MTLKLSDVRRALSHAGWLCAAVALAACGGGSSTTTFKPTRIIAFGDETSLIVDTNGDNNGSKYGVNAVVSATDTTRVCTGDPIWIQAIGNAYGLVFPQCNIALPPAATPVSRIRATFGATSADIATQIDAQLAESPFADGDLVTVLVGENDVIAQYALYPSVSETQIAASLEAAGAEVGRQVNRMADLGAKVIVSTIPDVGVTPFAATEKANNIDTDRAALLTRLSDNFNGGMRSALANDGRRIGLVLFNEFVGAVPLFPGIDGITYTTPGVCDLTQSMLTPPSVLDCTELTLIPNGVSTAYLWADDRHLSPGGQQVLGTLGLQRAQNNPF